MPNRRTPLFLATTVAVTALFLGGCASAGDAGTGDGASEPIRLGLIGAWSTSAFADDQPLRAAEIAAESINADGGVGGRPIEIVSYDTKGDPAAGLAGARKLVEEDGVVAFIGGNSGGGIAEVGAADGVVNWFPVGSDASDIANPLSYITAFNSTGYAESAYLGATAYEPEKIAFITPFSESLFGDQLRFGLTQAGFDLDDLEIIEVSADTTDYSAAITRLKEIAPDAWGVGLYPPSAVTSAIQAATEQGVEIPYFSSNNGFEAATAEALSVAPFPNVIATEKREDAQYSDVWGEYLDDLDTYDTNGDITQINDGSTTNNWFAVYSFAKEAEGLDEVTRETFRTHVEGLTDFDYDLIVPLDFTVDSPVKDQPRQFYAYGFQGYASGGEVHLNSGEPFSAYLDIAPANAPLTPDELAAQTDSGR